MKLKLNLHDPDFELDFDDACVVDISQPEDAACWAVLMQASVPELAYAISLVGVAPNAVEMEIELCRQVARSRWCVH